MKIEIEEPDGPYSCAVDPGVMRVTLKEVYIGVGFETPKGERLSVCMRDDGFEVIYHAAFGNKGFNSGITKFKDGRVITNKGSQ